MIIYDSEIVNGIVGRGEEPLPDIEYCNGWEDYDGMGISTICAYDYATDNYHVFMADNFSSFQKLVDETDIVIGFNSIKFDNQLCRANGINVPDEKSWDLLVAIWAAAGLGPKFDMSTHGGFGIQDCVSANFGLNKSGNGALAPVAWQRGYYGSVINYCMSDICLTKKLLDLVIRTGEIKHPRRPGAVLRVAPPMLEVVSDCPDPNWLS